MDSIKILILFIISHHQSTLKTLKLSYNYLHGVIPPEIFTMPNLEWLELTSNFFEGELPTTITAPLKYLFVTFKSITTPEFYNWLGNNNRYLDKNRLNGTIPDALGDLSLNHFFLMKNKFTCPISATLLEKLAQKSGIRCKMYMNEFEITDGKLCGEHAVVRKCQFLPTVGTFRIIFTIY